VTGRPLVGGQDGFALNRRDVEVLRFLVEGKSTAQIAAGLTVSPNTARTKIRRLQGKLQVSDRPAAVRMARDLGVVEVPPLA
jgi:DNA-binding CsgD family transcriptional regulator